MFRIRAYKDDEEEDPFIREERQAMKTFFCHRNNAGADMGNPEDNHDECPEIWQWGFDLDDNEHQQRKKRRKRTRTRSSRRKKKRAQEQVADRETELLDLPRFVCCILITIIVRASIIPR
jgi:hypothetical protein